jgi:hypothetical protein
MNNRRGATRALIAAVYPILNVSTFTAIATGGLHHGQAPQKTPLPYGVLQSPSGYPGLQSMGNPGEEVKFQLRVVSDGDDYAVALAAIDAAKQLLDGERPTVANHLVVRLWWEWTQTYADPELVNGVPVWNCVSQWCAWLDQVS